MDLDEMLESIVSWNDLANFVAALRKDLLENGHLDEWENPTLERYLDAMESWVQDALVHPSAFMAASMPPSMPSPRVFGQILYASKSYE